MRRPGIGSRFGRDLETRMMKRAFALADQPGARLDRSPWLRQGPRRLRPRSNPGGAHPRTPQRGLPPTPDPAITGTDRDQGCRVSTGRPVAFHGTPPSRIRQAGGRGQEDVGQDGEAGLVDDAAQRTPAVTPITDRTGTSATSSRPLPHERDQQPWDRPTVEASWDRIVVPAAGPVPSPETGATEASGNGRCWCRLLPGWPECAARDRRARKDGTRNEEGDDDPPTITLPGGGGQAQSPAPLQRNRDGTGSRFVGLRYRWSIGLRPPGGRRGSRAYVHDVRREGWAASTAKVDETSRDAPAYQRVGRCPAPRC